MKKYIKLTSSESVCCITKDGPASFYYISVSERQVFLFAAIVALTQKQHITGRSGL